MTSSWLFRHRGLFAGVSSLAAAGMVLPSPAAAAPIQPDYVRTIGQPGQSQPHPGGIDVDVDGNVYVADTGNDTIAKYPAGSATAEWVRGTRGAPMQNGSFSDPRDIAVGNSRLYVADLGHGAVQILDLNGAHLGKLNFRFKSAIGVSVGNDASGNPLILVSDGRTGNVEVFDASHQHVRSIPPRLSANSGTRDAATDSAGNFYVADYRNHKIQKFNPDGTWLLSWGGSGVPTCQQVPKPYGVAVDALDRVYVASSNANTIRSFSGNGSCLRSYGRYGTGDFNFTQLRRVAVSRTGTDPIIYGADLWGIKILLFALDGSVATPLGRIGDGWRPPPGGLNESPGVAVSKTGYVYAANQNNHRIDRWTTAGLDPIAWGRKGIKTSVAEFNWPMGVGVNDVNGHVWVADTHGSRLVEFGPDGGNPLRTFGSAGSGTSQVNWPYAVAFDPNGNMYVADGNNGRIISWDRDMAFRWQLKGLSGPKAVAYDPTRGRVLAADTNRGRILVLDPGTGVQFSVLPIPRGTQPGQIMAPRGLAVGPDGAIWVSSPPLNRVDRFAPDGTYANMSVGGTRGTGTYQLNSPAAIAVDGDGRLFVGDSWNSRIQVYSP